MIALLVAAVMTTSGGRLVDVTEQIPDAVLDIRYATAENFLGRRLYPAARCLLREDVARRLVRAAERLRARGYRLRLWDCYRPRTIQWEMWRARPEPGHVADPRHGSNHNRGAAVDLSLADRDGRNLEMPTSFDDFGPRARASATAGVSLTARLHRQILRDALEAEGFAVNPMEWWHYDAPGAKSHPVLDLPLDSAMPHAARDEPLPDQRSPTTRTKPSRDSSRTP